MKKNIYEIEKDGQIAFFKNYGIPYDEDNSILVENTDGIYNGILLEFKLTINNLNKVLMQAIKYLSRLRIKGESVPSTILLIDLNNSISYVYKSEDYREFIQKVYIGASSKNNEDFIANDYSEKIDYSTMEGSSRIKKLLLFEKPIFEKYMPVDLDEDCIVGWAKRYYQELPSANKGDFLGDDEGTAIKVTGEIRDPKHFKYLINPYVGKTNEKFKYLMDCLNDRLSKKDLGAYYTPGPYAKKAAELVKLAVDRIPEGNDYIILDRCAGTGNLEAELSDLRDKHGDTLVSHCILATYEYWEYKVLQERLGSKVREIIPPTEADVIYQNGKILNADAMSKDFIENPLIMHYVNNPHCSIIMFENPPYSDTSASDNSDSDDKTKKAKSDRKETYVAIQYNEIKNTFNEDKGSNREISNLFIWSAFNFYLKKESDSYIVFSPVKYWKSIHLVNKKLVRGYGFNRKHFHAGASFISCILWENTNSNAESITLELLDIDAQDDSLIDCGTIEIKKVYNTFLPYFDKREFDSDESTNVYLTGDGYQNVKNQECAGKSLYNENIIGYLRPVGYPIAALNRYLTRQILYNSRGFYLRKDNYLHKLPLFVAKCYDQNKWFKKDVYFTTSDGGDVYIRDEEFLKQCLIYTCLSSQNKCISFEGNDGHFYRNELCFDEGTLASNELAKYTLSSEEIQLYELWVKILEEARTTANYNQNWKYGIYQIREELNTFKEIGSGKKRDYDYKELNGNLEVMNELLKQYFNSNISNKLFKYSLLK